jgi:hypothetical protein
MDWFNERLLKLGVIKEKNIDEEQDSSEKEKNIQPTICGHILLTFCVLAASWVGYTHFEKFAFKKADEWLLEITQHGENHTKIT